MTNDQDTKETKKDLTDLFKVNESENDPDLGGVEMDDLGGAETDQGSGLEFQEFQEEPAIEQIDTFDDLEMLPEPIAADDSETPGEGSPEFLNELSKTHIVPAHENGTPPHPEPSLQTTPEAAPSPSRPMAPAEMLSQVKEYSESLVPSPVAASVPYSVMIEGRLSSADKDKLLELLSRENFGIRELDLEPQFEAGKILIPRISEYAAVILVQAIRSAHVRIHVFPSEGAVPSAAVASDSTTTVFTSVEAKHEGSHPAEMIPITPVTTLPQYKNFFVVDTVSASATLKSTALEVQSSSQFQEVLESLQREIKYKAYRKGASAIVGFSVTVTPLHLPSHYRLLVMGTAIHQSQN